MFGASADWADYLGQRVCAAVLVPEATTVRASLTVTSLMASRLLRC
jgi:hypothetical protein